MINLKFKNLKLLATFILLFTTFKVYSQSWFAIGPEEISALPKGEYTNVAAATDGAIYLSYRDANKSNKITVKKYSGSTLSVLGTAGFSAGAAYYTDITVNKYGTPYVAFMDGANANKATVMKYDGVSWSVVGAVGFSQSNAPNIIIATSPLDGSPYVAYQDGGNGNKITVKKYDGNSWIDVGTAGFSSGVANSINFSIDPDGNPFVVYQDESLDFKAISKKYVGSAWIDLSSSVSVGYADNLDIIISSSGIPYVSYIDDSGNIIVRKYAANLWTTIYSAPSATNPSLALTTDDYPYLVYKYNNSSIYGYKYSGTDDSWINTLTTNNYSSSSYLDLSISADNLPVIGLVEATQPLLLKGEGASLVSLYNQSISGASSKPYFNELKIAPDGTPYLLYEDYNSKLLYVKKYTNEAWTTVGSPQSLSSTTYPEKYNAQIAFNATGTPYIAYITSSGTINVKRYVANTWQALGSISGIPDCGVDLDIDQITGEPYLLYFAGSSSVSIKKYSGGSWQAVGLNIGYNYISTVRPKIRISPDGTPYVIYLSQYDGDPKLHKFNGTSWSSLGGSIVSVASSSTNNGFDLSFSSTNIPYVACNVDNTLYIRKFSNNSWSTVASIPSECSSFLYNHIRLLLDSNDSPYVAYINNAGSMLKIKKYSNSAWSDIGSLSNVSLSSASYPAIALINSTGNLYTAYSTSFGNYSKMYGTLTTLPVSLINFTAKAFSNGSATLAWSTASEENSNFFLVERSINEEPFAEIARVNSKGDNSRYSLIDNETTAGNNFYRLSQVDKDGKRSELGVRHVKIGFSSVNTIYPNPLKGNNFEIKLSNTDNQLKRIQIIDIYGRTISTKLARIENNILKIQLASKPTAGIYFVTVEGLATQKLVIE